MAERNAVSTPPARPADPPTSSPTSETNPLPTAETFLKPRSPRKRRRSPESPVQHSTHPTLRGFTTPVSPKSLLSPERTPRPLTGAAALADQKRQSEEQEGRLGRQISPNPAIEAIGALLGKNNTSGIRMQDASSLTTSVIRAVAPVAPMTAKSDVSRENHVVQTSPASTASYGTSGGVTIGPLGAHDVRVSSPGEMDQGGSEDRSDGGTRGDTGIDADPGHSNKAMTFPGPLLSAPISDARRGMSLPGSGLGRESQRSPSAKKHKCPYCSTDFTRHHNLKSHLLTHSHEKPYYCETCDARFRRLHDLKRHTKLHTGERPHVCPKCDRSFARGDALARHNKGQGGCAGRRSSMGSFGGDGNQEGRDVQGQDDGMHGLMYTGQASHEPEGMDDDASGAENAGRSLPSIRRHDAPPNQRQSGSDSGAYHTRQPSTYPPVAVRPPGSGGLYPPGASIGGGSSASTSPGALPSPNPFQHGASGPSAFQHPSPNVFAQGGMTESPTPLSPGGAASHQLGHPDSGIHRNRSPSLSQQFQQQQFGRRSSTLNNSPQTGLPPPHLPSLPGLSAPEPRFTLHSQAAGTAGGPTSPSFHSQPGSQNNSLSSHGTGPHGCSGEGTANAFAPSTDGLWAYVRSLEMKIDRLQDEVGNLRGQLNNRQ